MPGKIRNSRTDDKEEPVEKEETLPGNVSKEQKAEGACRIGNTYYEDLSAALHAVKDNETIYIVQSHTMKDSFVYVEKTRTRSFRMSGFARGRSENGQDAGPAQAGIYKIKCCDRK